MVMARLAWSCRDSARRRSPGSIHDHPSASPVPAATKIAVSSSSPWGVMNPQNTSATPLAWNNPPANPTLAAFRPSSRTVGRQARMPPAKAPKPTWMLLKPTSAKNCPDGRSE